MIWEKCGAPDTERFTRHAVALEDYDVRNENGDVVEKVYLFYMTDTHEVYRQTVWDQRVMWDKFQLPTRKETT